MRRQTLVMALVVLLITVTQAARTQGEATPLCAEGEQAGVRFKVSLQKNVFVESEPIILTLTLTNTTDKETVLGELAYWTASSSIVRKSGAEMPGGIELSMVQMPVDFGRVFRPGESYSLYRDISWRWSGMLPAEPYILKSEYHSDPDAVGNRRIQWKGRIVLPDLSFEIVPPRDAREKAAFELYRNTPYLTGDKASIYKAAIIMHGLSEPALGGVFASSAGYREAEALREAGDRPAYISALRRYADKHKEEPYYYRQALTSLGDALCKDGNYAEARAVYAKLPDGYFTQGILKDCDEHLPK